MTSIDEFVIFNILLAFSVSHCAVIDKTLLIVVLPVVVSAPLFRSSNALTPSGSTENCGC